MKFVDLFAGLGGFHLALRHLGHECVMTSEIDAELRDVYRQNFVLGVDEHKHSPQVEGDIRKIPIRAIPKHDILCAGFPCQPFSQAGNQQGLDCPQWGDLFDHIIRIIEHHKPTYFMLENVPNIIKHNNGATWDLIIKQLGTPDWGYKVDYKILSPHQFGIPQVRKRVFIVGSRKKDRPLGWFKELRPPESPRPDLRTVLDKHPQVARPLPAHYIQCLEVWDEFIKKLHEREGGLPSFPIWSMEFGATYPYEESTPFTSDIKKLRKLTGSFGQPLKRATRAKLKELLPSHALRNDERFPLWKQSFIRENRALWERNKDWLTDWLPKIRPFASSLQKLEWNCKGEAPDVWQYILQFRASGVRVKRPTTAPSLIAMTTTQIPIVAWERRFMTMQECARLQGMEDLEYLPRSETAIFRALGNAVNANLVRYLAAALLDEELPQECESHQWTELSESEYIGPLCELDLSNLYVTQKAA